MALAALKKVEATLKLMEPKVLEHGFLIDNLNQIPNFIEKMLPALQTMRTGQFLRNIFGEKNLDPKPKKSEEEAVKEEPPNSLMLKKIYDYEIKQMSEIIEYNDIVGRPLLDVAKFNKRLQIFARNCKSC